MWGKRFSFFAALLILVALGSGWAQEAVQARPSPMAVAAIKYKDAYVKITYSQPQKRGREIFGTLVPYGQVWRLGANEATEITVTKNISLSGFLLKAGTYSMFAIPQKDKWTIIINSELGLWGAYNYNYRLDVLRFDVPVQNTTGAIYEPFTLQFDQRNDAADLLILWDRIKLSIPVKFIN
ncbi:DUF2911 domain-containing protein [Chryseolinea lacunae]|uniref:DUF2911 domain-containing protein n=1 Tax=Chryseolinea lacunae TaxID=2801331 RepID=A0ABS1KWG9_9BACT|nr:DUF2911 domain-containing protein [Chryseolinea lacunae]MBL0743806.1 DUF2911 domain-containing protein [Chryseolinea lacunae]